MGFLMTLKIQNTNKCCKFVVFPRLSFYLHIIIVLLCVHEIAIYLWRSLTLINVAPVQVILLHIVHVKIVGTTVPEFLKGSFSAWKQAENAHFWKWAFSPRDKRRSETWVVFGPLSACFRPHQTNTLVLEEKMKTILPECFHWKRAYVF
jgi:hypothetical protein